MRNRKSKNFISWNDVPFEEIAKGIKRQIMGYDETLMLVKVYFEKGVEAELHSHALHSQSTYIAAGKFEITIDKEVRILEQGDGFFMPPGTPHNAKCLEEGLLIDTFSPCRLEFLE